MSLPCGALVQNLNCGITQLSPSICIYSKQFKFSKMLLCFQIVELIHGNNQN